MQSLFSSSAKFNIFWNAHERGEINVAAYEGIKSPLTNVNISLGITAVGDLNCISHGTILITLPLPYRYSNSICTLALT